MLWCCSNFEKRVDCGFRFAIETSEAPSVTPELILGDQGNMPEGFGELFRLKTTYNQPGD